MDQIRLQEYREAGEACRSQATLIRNGLTLFAAIQTAVLSFIATSGDQHVPEFVLLEGFGLVVSVVTAMTIQRLQFRYADYMRRARKLECRLGMDLYSSSHRRDGCRGGWGNRKWLPVIPTAAAVVYAVLLLWAFVPAISEFGGS